MHSAHGDNTIAMSGESSPQEIGMRLSARSNGNILFKDPCRIYKPVNGRTAGETKKLQVFG